MKLQEINERNVTTTAALSRFWSAKLITSLDVIPVLNKAKIPFVLIGLYGLATWIKEPRATQDVDVVVAARQVKKAVRVLLTAFPNLEADDQEVVVRLRDRELNMVVIDVVKPTQPLLMVLFKNTKTVSTEGHEYRIPTLEMALALKFAPMISLTRQDEDKHQDAHDFILTVKNNPNIDLNKLAELGDLVYPGGSKELLELVRQVRAGEKLIL